MKWVYLLLMVLFIPLASGQIVNVDSTYSGYSSGVVDDGVVDAFGGSSTTWASGESSSGPHWVEFVWSSPVSWSNVSVFWAWNDFRSSYTTSQELQVQYWDGSGWVTVGYINDFNVSVSSLSFSSVSSSRWRLFQPAARGMVNYQNVMWLSEVDWGVGGCVLESDLDGDCVVDISDVLIVAQNIGRTSSFGNADRNSDGIVNVFDLVLVARNFGSSSGSSGGSCVSSVEVCDGVDNDCDGLIDEGCSSNGLMGDILFTETFDDESFSSRGWYDNTNVVVASGAGVNGGALEFHWPAGAVLPDSGGAMRKKFNGTDSVYLSYWVRHSSTWTGSDHNYHPHIFQFLTDEDSDYLGPAISHLTLYVESNEGRPVLARQDALNIDESRVNQDLSGVTESRAVSGCNGNSDGHPVDCYFDGTRWRNGGSWRASEVWFSDSTGSRYKGDWHRVEAYFELNSIQGSVGVADGRLRYWYDGQLVMGYDDVLFRTGAHPDMLFNQFLIGPYIGDGSPVDQTMWIDNLTIAMGRVNSSESSDITAPLRSNGAPTGTLRSGTTSATLRLSTDESATCRYSTSSGISYSDMSVMGSTGSTSHSQLVSVSDGNSYDFYVRCQDSSGNINTNDYAISFSVAEVQSVLHPNEPAGFTQLTERFFDAVVEDDWGYYELEGEMTIQEDASAPQSPLNVGRVSFPTSGWGGSLQPVSAGIGGWNSSEVYVEFWFKVSENWKGHASGVNKIIYLTRDGANPLFFLARGSSNNTLTFSIYHQDSASTFGTHSRSQIIYSWNSAGIDEPGYGNYYANEVSPSESDAEIVRGQWHHVEVLVRENTDDVADGEIHAWLDGEKIMQFTAVEFSGNPVGLQNIKWEPIWGGMDDTPVPEMYQYMDYFYVSVNPDMPDEVHPNEPSGFTTVVDRNWSSINKANWLLSPDADGATVESDVNAPVSPPDISRITFPAGFEGGYSTAGFSAESFTGMDSLYTGGDSLYVDAWVRHSENWHGHSTGVNKIMYTAIGDPTGYWRLIINANTRGDEDPYLQMRTQATPQGARNLDPYDMQNAIMPRGQWNHIEVLMIANNPPAADGEIHWWLNGNKVGEVTDLEWLFEGESMNYWHGFQWKPIWGGAGDTVPAEQYIEMDHAYVSTS